MLPTGGQCHFSLSISASVHLRVGKSWGNSGTQRGVTLHRPFTGPYHWWRRLDPSAGKPRSPRSSESKKESSMQASLLISDRLPPATHLAAAALARLLPFPGSRILILGGCDTYYPWPDALITAPSALPPRSNGSQRKILAREIILMWCRCVEVEVEVLHFH